jgi:hypothetical protein
VTTQAAVTVVKTITPSATEITAGTGISYSVTVHSSHADSAQAPITGVDTATVLAAPMIFGLVCTGVDAAALFLTLTAALMLLLVGIGLL